jgi:hypothetical protein
VVDQKAHGGQGADMGRKLDQRVNEHGPKIMAMKIGEGLFCHRCIQTGHVARDCLRGWQGEKEGKRV